MTPKPTIPSYLLWEYDLATFDYSRSYKIVIERIMQLGKIEDWKEMIRFYSDKKIKETLEWTKQLPERDKYFARLFLKSDLLENVA